VTDVGATGPWSLPLQPAAVTRTINAMEITRMIPTYQAEGAIDRATQNAWHEYRIPRHMRQAKNLYRNCQQVVSP